MMQMMWRVPGHALALAYIVWAVAVSFLGSGHGQSGQDLTAALMILPFFLWLSVASHQLLPAGRPWWKASLAPALFALWSSYALVVVPFLLEENAGIAGSESLGLVVNSLFAVSLILAYDQVAFAIPRAEEAKGRRRSGYVVTLLELLFPPVARTGASSPRPLYLTECLLIGPKENAA